jgi:hypothetical protein
VFGTVYSGCQYAQVAHGAGRHLATILQNDPSDSVESQKYAFAAQIAIIPALALPKLSICLTYLRIFHMDARGRRLILILISIILVPALLYIFLGIFQCKPVQAYWTEGRPRSKCVEDILGLYISGSLNVLIDIALMAIVLSRVLKLHLHVRQKWALNGIVGLGSLAAIAGLVRMIRVGTTLTKPNFDATWDMYDISIWTSTEIYVSLICASAPGIKPLVTKVLPKLLGSSISSRSQTGFTVDPPGSIELELKLRRGTIGSNRVRAQAHMSMLGEEERIYEQLGRGFDRDSLFESKKNEVNQDSLGRVIMKTSEIYIRSSIMHS